MQDSRWQFFTSSETTWQALLLGCAEAKKSIDLEEYVFGWGGEIEKQFVDLFLKKAKEGVKIRLLLDGIGSWSFYRSSAYKELEKVGVEISYHFLILPPPIKRLFPFMLRDHRKLVVIDETTGYVGGVIIEERARDWRDTFVKIEGPVVNDMAAAFQKGWKRTKRWRPVGQVKSENENQEFVVMGNSFHLHDKDLYRAFLKAITSAKEYIYITTPYFFPNDEFLRAVYFARDRGVKVAFLLPKLSDNKIADFLGRFFYKTLRKHGVEIYLYTKKILHAKTIVVDQNWSSVGSCNFDWLSLWFNYELNIISTNRDFTRELTEHFLEDIREAESIP